MAMSQFHPVSLLADRYPQLTLPIKEGISSTEEYADICLRGMRPTAQPEFTGNDKDSIETIHTPAGDVEALSLFEREDFEHAFMAMANRCEPMEIPASTGAVMISGLINWDKVRAITGPLSSVDKSAYRDSFIILSAGPYSNVHGDVFGIEEDEWILRSITIRKYHELTHFISRKLFPDNKNAIRDEIMADMMGIMFAFDRYDVYMARYFLGIEGSDYREGGRLQNYVQEGSTLEDTVKEAGRCIDLFSEGLAGIEYDSPFDVLIRYEEERLAL